MDLEELQAMKYRELQKLAKEKGVKANQPKAEIIKNLLEVDKETDKTEVEEEKPEESNVNTTFEKEDSKDELNATFEKEASPIDLNTTFEKEPSDKINATFEKEESDQDSKTEPKPSRFVEFVAEETNKENSPKKRLSIKRKTKSPAMPQKPSVAVQARKIATPRRTNKVPMVWTPAKTYLAANPPAVTQSPAPKTPKPSVLSMTYLMSVSTPATTPTRTNSAKKTPSLASGKSASKKSKTPGKTPSRAMMSNKKKSPTSDKKGAKVTQIPRFVSFARKAPNFAKLHEKQFNKMPSLVDTVEKKRKRTESVQEQIKRVKSITESHQKIVSQCKSKNPVAKDAPKFVPSVTSTAKMNLNFGGGQTAPVTSTAKMNLNFGGGQTAPNAFNFTAEKTGGPVIKKPVSREPRKNLKTITKKSTATPKAKPANLVSKTPVNKPFLNLTNKSFSNKSLTSSPKNAFDLKASLAKPLGYKPHTGKLKAWENKKKVVAEKNGGMTFAEVKIKQLQVIKGVRLNKRAELLMQKRNME